MLTVAVMPCLDEAADVRDTIASLGFLEAAPPVPDAHLVVVDNGSTDGTLDILERICARSPSSVHVVTEVERGYVPPRTRGVREAMRLASILGVDADETLILQVDADTIYRTGYVATMRRAAAAGHGVLLEGSTKPPPGFAERHPEYVAAQRLVDDQVEWLDARDEDEVVLDDKVCGYRLSDYLEWGGLFPEECSTGDAIHAETTRMFIRARLRCGARKIRVNPAGAIPSRRRIIEDPSLQYATAGFPREASWIAQRRRAGEVPSDIDTFARRVVEGRESEAVRLRIAHQLVLFRHLPALVAVVDGMVNISDLPIDVQRVLRASAIPSRMQMSERPGEVITALLGLIDSAPEIFVSIP
ncbi:glycosyltransferase [uncultured Sphingomonas sp.]|uniref:glycosyltransferase family 2 protein n=1 Tax=uncultured Sphingomonas sp. TaxID=158754 RepID=UPI0025E6F751|nr:glycosyltransferase [uncultured Sphingomonas sp.]